MTGLVSSSACPDVDKGVSREVLAQLDEAGTCAEHWKILITAGTGFFADAYDLFMRDRHRRAGLTHPASYGDVRGD